MIKDVDADTVRRKTPFAVIRTSLSERNNGTYPSQVAPPAESSPPTAPFKHPTNLFGQWLVMSPVISSELYILGGNVAMKVGRSEGHTGYVPAGRNGQDISQRLTGVGRVDGETTEDTRIQVIDFHGADGPESGNVKLVSKSSQSLYECEKLRTRTLKGT